MAYSRFLVSCFVLALGVFGCKSHSSGSNQTNTSRLSEIPTDQTTAEEKDDNVAKQTDNAPAQEEGGFNDFAIVDAGEEPLPDCPVPDNWCSDDEQDRILCSATSLDEKPLKDDEALHVFGANFCEARKSLFRLGCEKGFKPKQLGEVVCMPDPTGGNCPFEPGICITIYDPATCVARSYDGQPLTEDTSLKAKGSNECRATEALKAQACINNLDPKKLEDIECEKDLSAANDGK